MKSAVDITKVAKTLAQLQAYWGKAIIGKPEVLQSVLISLLCRGHLLLEDVPGLGKTTLAKVVSKSMALTFKRIQCTPDLLPADISGVSIYDQKEQTFRFIPGPVFSNILLADEINRTSPRTQSALLEAMAERTVTVDRQTRPLPDTFMVIATQNPIEFSGTYPLPEAQLDRFFMRISLGYPSLDDETRIMLINQKSDPSASVGAVLKEAQLVELQAAVHAVHIDDKIMAYIAQLVHATRNNKMLRLGSSPRGAIALMKAGQALALIQGTGFVTAQMVQHVFKPVLSHRVLPRGDRDDVDSILDDILRAIPVPAMPSPGGGKDKITSSDEPVELS